MDGVPHRQKADGAHRGAGFARLSAPPEGVVVERAHEAYRRVADRLQFIEERTQGAPAVSGVGHVGILLHPR